MCTCRHAVAAWCAGANHHSQGHWRRYHEQFVQNPLFLSGSVGSGDARQDREVSLSEAAGSGAESEKRRSEKEAGLRHSTTMLGTPPVLDVPPVRRLIAINGTRERPLPPVLGAQSISPLLLRRSEH